MNANSKVQNVRNSSLREKQSEGARSTRPRSFFVKKFPKYQIHKATNRAFVWWNDRREYLGEANSPESLERYNQFIAEIARLGRAASPVRGEYARDEDGDGFHEVHVNTMEGAWSLLRSWLRPHRGISQERRSLYVGFFQFVHNVRSRGNSLLRSLVEALVCVNPEPV